MSRKKVFGIALLIGAIIVAAVGTFTMHAGHNKTGLGLIVLGIIVLALSLYTFFSHSTAEKYQVDREWM
jgi:uncharacterized membrane protein YfcA